MDRLPVTRPQQRHLQLTRPAALSSHHEQRLHQHGEHIAGRTNSRNVATLATEGNPEFIPFNPRHRQPVAVMIDRLLSAADEKLHNRLVETCRKRAIRSLDLDDETTVVPIGQRDVEAIEVARRRLAKAYFPPVSPQPQLRINIR
jgi:hypothetical protein